MFGFIRVYLRSSVAKMIFIAQSVCSECVLVSRLWRRTCHVYLWHSFGGHALNGYGRLSYKIL